MTETSTPANPGTPYGAPGAPGTSGRPTQPGGTAFFDWVRSLGFVRGQDRWLAGVCGAVAARTGLDPLIVRGIAVVIAILGGPIFFLYAVGWALIPDQSGRSLVEQAARQVFEPAMIVVGALVFFTFVPWMQGIWWQGPPEIWGMPGWLEVLLRTSWAIGLTVAVIFLVIYVAKRVPSPRTAATRSAAAGAAAPSASAPAAPAPAAPVPPASAPPAPVPPTGTTDAPDPTPSAKPSDTTSASSTSAQTAPYGSAPDSDPTATFVPPIPPVPDAPTKPSLWDDWTGTSGSAGRPAYSSSAGSAAYGSTPYGSTPYGSAPYGSTPYGSAPYGSTPYGSTQNGPGARPAASASAFDPDRYRTAHRRRQLGAGFISVVSGLALTIGAIAAAVVADGNWSNSAFLVGAGAALAVVALGIVIAGIIGKEGGWLNGISIVLASTMAWTAFVPAGSDFVTFGSPTWEYTTGESAGFAMLAGAPTIDLTRLDASPSVTDRTIDVWLAFGDVELVLPENRTVLVEAANLAGGIDYDTPEVAARESGVLVQDSRIVVEGSGIGVTTVRVWNGFGEVTINQPAAPALR
jgi:phage shock protein PspC (stress-responsive transcriptional regulator)